MTALVEPARERLRAVLERSADQGWLGPGGVDAHIDHALVVADALKELVDLGAASLGAGVLDLGSGGGVPGLVVAVALAPIRVTLLDSAARRCAFLRTAAGELADLATITVVEGRAETLARDIRLAGNFGVVTARLFGRPAVTAECATGFLGIGGSLVVTEPPQPAATDERWPASALVQLGFAAAVPAEHPGARLVVIPKVGEAAEKYPRRSGVPAKRPLWG